MNVIIKLPWVKVRDSIKYTVITIKFILNILLNIHIWNTFNVNAFFRFDRYVSFILFKFTSSQDVAFSLKALQHFCGVMVAIRGFIQSTILPSTQDTDMCQTVQQDICITMRNLVLRWTLSAVLSCDENMQPYLLKDYYNRLSLHLIYVW